MSPSGESTKRFILIVKALPLLTIQTNHLKMNTTTTTTTTKLIITMNTMIQNASMKLNQIKSALHPNKTYHNPNPLKAIQSIANLKMSIAKLEESIKYFDDNLDSILESRDTANYDIQVLIDDYYSKNSNESLRKASMNNSIITDARILNIDQNRLDLKRSEKALINERASVRSLQLVAQEEFAKIKAFSLLSNLIYFDQY